MKNISKIIAIAIVGTLVIMVACKEPFDMDPVPSTTPSTYTTNFVFANASVDAPSLDFFVNGVKVGTSAAADTTSSQNGYTAVPLVSNGVFANTSISARPTSGTIGGVLGSANVIYRSANNGTGNFTAIDLKGYTGTGKYDGYTVIAVDSIYRPAPLRTLNATNFGDITYYSTKDSFTSKSVIDGVTDTTIDLTVGSSNSIVTANLVKKYNANVLPSFMIPIGIVPLGSSDPGGVRFYLTQDVFPIFANATDSTTKAGFRFLNTSPTSAASVSVSSYTGTLYARLVGTPNLTLSTGATYVVANANLNPTVGSRTVTASAANFTLLTLSSPATYEIQVSTVADFSVLAARSPGFTFVAGKNYTIYTKGLIKGVGENRLRIGVIQHN